MRNYDVILEIVLSDEFVDKFRGAQIIVNEYFGEQADSSTPFSDVFCNHVWQGIGNVNVQWTVNLDATPDFARWKGAGVIIHRENSDVIVHQDILACDFGSVCAKATDDLWRILVDKHG